MFSDPAVAHGSGNIPSLSLSLSLSLALSHVCHQLVQYCPFSLCFSFVHLLLVVRQPAASFWPLGLCPLCSLPSTFPTIFVVSAWWRVAVAWTEFVTFQFWFDELRPPLAGQKLNRNLTSCCCCCRFLHKKVYQIPVNWNVDFSCEANKLQRHKSHYTHADTHTSVAKCIRFISLPQFICVSFWLKKQATYMKDELLSILCISFILITI